MDKKFISDNYNEILDNEIMLVQSHDVIREILFEYSYLLNLQNNLIASFPYVLSSRDKEDLQMCWRYAKNKSDSIEISFGYKTKENANKNVENITKENATIEDMGYNVLDAQKSIQDIISYVKNLKANEKQNFAREYVDAATTKFNMLADNELIPQNLQK